MGLLLDQSVHVSPLHLLTQLITMGLESFLFLLFIESMIALTFNKC
jgi:hypothetical protein